MTSLTGYALQHRLHRGVSHLIYRGRRQWDDQAVVLKISASRFPSPHDLSRLRRDFAMLQRLDGRGAPRALALEQHEQGLVLVMEDTGGRTLKDLIQHGPLDIYAFLDIALSCCDALSHVHSNGILHRDITPNNILLDPDGNVRFIDFADAEDLNLAQFNSEALPLLSGTPAYMSPEQTGRLHRRLDQRSDYYSLGATFYELLTGQPPFSGEDTLDLIHAHLSRTPEPLTAHAPDLPRGLSDLVLKLLAKPTEERYQSLRSLKTALTRCRDHAYNTALPLSAFQLEDDDKSELFRLSQRLYGRDTQIATLQAVLGHLEDGHPELILIEGPSGTGKTALSRDVLRLMKGRPGAVVFGAFEEFRRNVPYAAISEAFSVHLRSVLAGSEQDLHAVKERLDQALGGQGSILCDVLPDLTVLIGPQPPLTPLSALETENRFAQLFRAMMGAVVGRGQTLVLVLDDLQWADRSSLYLLQNLLNSSASRHGLLVVGTRRSDLPESSQSLDFFLDRIESSSTPVHRLALPPLDHTDVLHLLTDSFGQDGDETALLADVCLQKTRGNPYFLLRFLTSLYEQGLLFFHHGQARWQWALQDIASLDITDNVIDLMVEKLARLSPVGNRVVQRASCIGPIFDLFALSCINDVSPQETFAQLQESLQQGLIIPTSADLCEALNAGAPLPDPNSVSFRFLHERIHKTAYDQITPAERGLRHLNIGRALLDNTNSSTLYDRLFAIVDQLNRGQEQIRDAEFAYRVAHLNLEASRKARSSAAYSTALTYAQQGLRCLYPDTQIDSLWAWGNNHSLTLDLHTEATEALFQLGDHGVMARHIAIIEQNANGAQEKARIIELKIAALIQHNNNRAALELALEQLAALGYPLPMRPGPLRRWWALRQCQILQVRLRQNISTVGGSTSARVIAAQRLISVTLPAILFCAPSLLPVATELNLRLAEDVGSLDSAAYAIARYATTMAAMGNVSSAVQAAQTALEMTQTAPQSHIVARCAFAALFHGIHWAKPLREIRDRIFELLQKGIESQDPERMGYVTAGYLACSLHAGVELSSLEQDIVLVRDVVRRVNSDWGSPYVSCLLQLLDNLRSPKAHPTSLQGEFHNEAKVNQDLLNGRNLLMLNALLSLKMMLCTIFGRYDDVRHASSIVQLHSWALAGTPIGPSYELYHALSWTRDPNAGSVPKRLQVLKRSLGKFRFWNTLCPANIQHRERLLSAELARLSGQVFKAAELYDQAIKAAHNNGYSHEEALINEFAAEFHQQRGRPMIAEAYRRQAHYRWRLWGATSKAALMEEDWPELATGSDDESLLYRDHQSSIPRRDGRGVDLTAVMKAARAISGEIRRPALLESLLRITMGAAGAQRGLLFLRSPRGWSLEAESLAQNNHFELYRLPVPKEDPAGGPSESSPMPRFSRAIFNYTTRTREAVVLNNAALEGPFTNDPYIAQEQTRSLLCLPLFQQSEFKGILYLENNLTMGAFTTDRQEILRLLVAQVVISLDNALLYENLSELNQTLEAEVAERTREAVEKSRLLETTLDNMSDGLVVYDASNHLLLSNERVLQLFNLPPHLATPGTPNEDLLRATIRSGALAPRVADLLQSRLDNNEEPFPDRATSEIELSNGRFLQMRRTIMPDGRQVHIFLDVTEERRRERELDAARQAAEKALETLQNAQESLVHAEKMASLGHLVAGVAHEINTPIGITLTAASFLAERAHDIRLSLNGEGIRKSQLLQFIEQADETTALMMNNIHRASELIKSFKQVATDQTSGERRRFRLHAYLVELIRSFTPLLRKGSHSITLTCPEHVEAYSYPGALSQVLTNLVMNSITHGFEPQKPGHITLTAKVLSGKTEASELELWYHDNGVGIPPEHINQVFDPFFTTRRGTGGSGLGLNIVYNTVTSVLKGSITVSSVPSEGTTFVIRIPLETPSPDPSSVPTPLHAFAPAVESIEVLPPEDPPDL